MTKRFHHVLTIAGCVCFATALAAREYHVSPEGDDKNDGAQSSPLRTITQAAYLAHPGDAVTVHAGVYRERIDPLRGGESDERRIVYQAAPGEEVVLKGSEIVTEWKKASNGLWSAQLKNSMFGTTNPYNEFIYGDYILRNKGQHTGMVYINGKPVAETTSLEKFLSSKSKAETPEWATKPDYNTTTIYLRLPADTDPNKETVEINVRKTVFYPTREHIDYITVRGFHMMHAATNWAPPTAEQEAMLGTHWSKGWIIEDNVIEYSRCAGISLGKYGSKYDNTFARNSQAYVSMIERAVRYYGWSMENVGHHIVRGNTIAHCGQVGVVGAMGAVASTVEDNEIYDIAKNQLFGGYETACVKFHAPIDVVISHNYFHDCGGFSALWLDWMAQGTRVTGNVFRDNSRDFYLEVNHGPLMVDHNFFLSTRSKASANISGGTAFVHNLFLNGMQNRTDKRITPYFEKHSTKIVDYAKPNAADAKFYNNIFAGPKTLIRNKSHTDLTAEGNVYLNGARPIPGEKNPIVDKKFKPNLKIVEENGKLRLEMNIDPSWLKAERRTVTTELLGLPETTKLPFVHPDDTPYNMVKDFHGTPWSKRAPAPGPLNIVQDKTKIDVVVWPPEKTNASGE